jgi:6,7-dimethyl-8-ribityllumazine synthase
MSLNKPGTLHLQGIQIPKDAFVVIVKTEWNEWVVDELEKGCMQILGDHQVSFHRITVPGAFEIPFAIKNYWENLDSEAESPLAFIALGCIIQGDTPHFDFVAKAVTGGILHLNLHYPVPTIFGVLTVNNEQQARERIGGSHGHKGEEAAYTAIKMIAINHQSSR